MAIPFHEKADKRDIKTLQDVQVQDNKNISTKAAAAAKRCHSSIGTPRWQLAQLQVKGSQQYYRVRAAESQREAPGYRKVSGAWGTAKQFKTFRGKKGLMLRRGPESGISVGSVYALFASQLDVTGTWLVNSLLAFPTADWNSLAKVYRQHWCKQTLHQVTVIHSDGSGTQGLLSRIRTRYKYALNKTIR